MKKKICFIFFLSIIICNLTACSNNKEVAVNQSYKNFDEYVDQIKNLIAEYDEEYEIKPGQAPSETRQREVVVCIDEGQSISILMGNMASENTQEGSEYFSAAYEIGHDSDDEFDVGLFVDIVNIISGKELTEDFCSEFLEAPEDEYPASSYNFNKLNGEKIAKIYSFNFAMNWSISYILDKDSNETLSFGGFTKASAK